MVKHKRPAYYPVPPKSRKAMIVLLMDHEGYQRYQMTSSPLAWNVKCYGVDFSAEHLIEVYRTSGEYASGNRWLDYPEWRVPALEKYKEIEDHLFEWAQEAAARQVDDDTNRCLWKGTEMDVKYGFSGRSGGWLIMTKYNGTDMTGMDRDDFEEYLEGLSYAELRDLTELVLQNDHDFSRKQVEKEMEYQAAYAWIENCCVDITRPEKTQAELSLAD